MRQERYDAFTTAFEHIAGVIDPIFKDLTRSRFALHSSWLLLKEAELASVYHMSELATCTDIEGPHVFLYASTGSQKEILTGMSSAPLQAVRCMPGHTRLSTVKL